MTHQEGPGMGVEPRTEAGRELLAAIEADLEEQDGGPEGRAAAERFRDRIAAIEDEAVRELRGALKVALDRLTDYIGINDDPDRDEDRQFVLEARLLLAATPEAHRE